MTARKTRFVQADDAYDKAAELVADAIVELATDRPNVRFAVTGGSAVASVVRALELLEARSFDFGRLFLTWIDERCVPVASPDSNSGAVPLERAPGQVLPLYLDDETPSEAVARVGAILASTFEAGLDCVFLGMGPDGHVASLFPDRPDPDGLVAHIADSPKPPPNRITLTRRLLETSRHTLLVARGEGKRAALERLYASDPTLPATGLADVVVTDLHLGES